MKTFLGEHETLCVALLDGIGGNEGNPCDLPSDTLAGHDRWMTGRRSNREAPAREPKVNTGTPDTTPPPAIKLEGHLGFPSGFSLS
jgi:hypothetical protein